MLTPARQRRSKNPPWYCWGVSEEEVISIEVFIRIHISELRLWHCFITRPLLRRGRVNSLLVISMHYVFKDTRLRGLVHYYFISLRQKTTWSAGSSVLADSSWWPLVYRIRWTVLTETIKIDTVIHIYTLTNIREIAPNIFYKRTNALSLLLNHCKCSVKTIVSLHFNVIF